MRRRPVLAVTALLLLVAACSSDATRPTLPNRTTVPGAGTGSTPGPEPTAGADTTAAPAPTDAPATTTAPAPTAAPDTTAAPAPTTGPAATDAPAPTVAPGTDDDEGTTWWPWVLVGLVVVGGVALLATRRRRPTWEQRVTPMLDDLDRVTSNLAALTPDGLRVVAATDAAALASLRATLATLVADAPDDRRRAALDSLTAPVADLHVAVGSVALSPGVPPVPGVPPPPPTPGTPSVAQLAAVVHTTSATVRAAVVPPPTPSA